MQFCWYICCNYALFFICSCNYREILFFPATFCLCNCNHVFTFDATRECSSLVIVVECDHGGDQAARSALLSSWNKPGLWALIQAKSGIESSEPIAIPINVLEFRDDDDDRGDGGRVAVDDDQLRSLNNPRRPYSPQNPRFCYRRADAWGTAVTTNAYRNVSSVHLFHKQNCETILQFSTRGNNYFCSTTGTECVCPIID